MGRCSSRPQQARGRSGRPEVRAIRTPRKGAPSARSLPVVVLRLARFARVWSWPSFSRRSCFSLQPSSNRTENEGFMKDTITGADVGMKLARTRLLNKNKNNKPAPLCLACGKPATNQLPTCDDPKCVKTVRPINRWTSRVSDLTTTKGFKKAA